MQPSYPDRLPPPEPCRGPGPGDRQPRTHEHPPGVATLVQRPAGCPEHLGFYLLGAGDYREQARAVSCHQEIAADGFFSLGMLADVERSLQEFGPAFYRHLFWESGVVGQTLYLDAEAAGARATGIGCFFDDPVHDVLGLSGHAFQSLYHFTTGIPVEDSRLMTAPGYEWE